ncbi:hypothetical protein STEG23_005952 [Scotinomys teguina]
MKKRRCRRYANTADDIARHKERTVLKLKKAKRKRKESLMQYKPEECLTHDTLRRYTQKIQKRQQRDRRSISK